MKTRVVVGVAGFTFVLLALYIFPPFVMEIMMAVLCVLATYEILGATKLVRNQYLLGLSALVSLLLVLAHSSYLPAERTAMEAALIVLLLVGGFALLLRFHESMRAEETLCAFFGALVVPYLLLAILRIYQMPNGSLLVLLPLLAAWGADTCALFAGMLFGKHKMAPVISPKKTVEGAIGGIVGGTGAVVIAAALMNHFAGLSVPLWAAAILGVIGAGFGEIGDLSFSVIKRQSGIKDYGSFFPGHGGVLDRFDSVIFVAPLAELILQLLH